MIKSEKIYLDKNLLQNFLNLVSEKISHQKINTNKIYIGVNEIAEAFHITGNYESAFQDLEDVIEKVNLKNLGIKALKAISCTLSDPSEEIPRPIKNIGRCDPTLKGILFKIDLKKIEKSIGKYPDSEETEEKSPYALPPKTKWEEVEMKFKANDDVDILVKGKFYETVDYEKLGFLNGKKSKKPNRQWIFLQQLSIAQGKNEMEATVDQMTYFLESKTTDKKITKGNCEQIKLKLEENLSKIFDIDDRPFWEYEKYKCYKTKFKLKPVPLLRTEEPYTTKRRDFIENFDYGDKGKEKQKEYFEGLYKKDESGRGQSINPDNDDDDIHEEGDNIDDENYESAED